MRFAPTWPSSFRFPEVTQAIHRKAMGGSRLQENGISLEAGSTLEQLRQELGSGASYMFYDVDRMQASFGQEMAVVWENIPQDISRPGVYTVVCRPAGIPEWLAVELPEFQVSHSGCGAGPGPHIQEIFRMEETVAFRYFRQITGADEHPPAVLRGRRKDMAGCSGPCRAARRLSLPIWRRWRAWR